MLTIQNKSEDRISVDIHHAPSESEKRIFEFPYRVLQQPYNERQAEKEVGFGKTSIIYWLMDGLQSTFFKRFDNV